jgi:hypothetical protein
VQNLTDAQKTILRQIHARYGVFGQSPLSCTVTEGEQTVDLRLK